MLIEKVFSTKICVTGHYLAAQNGWKKSKKMPKVAGLACECLLRRQNKEDAPEPKTAFFVLVPDRHVIAFQSFTAALPGIDRTLIVGPPSAQSVVR